MLVLDAADSLRMESVTSVSASSLRFIYCDMIPASWVISRFLLRLKEYCMIRKTLTNTAIIHVYIILIRRFTFISFIKLTPPDPALRFTMKIINRPFYIVNLFRQISLYFSTFYCAVLPPPVCRLRTERKNKKAGRHCRQQALNTTPFLQPLLIRRQCTDNNVPCRPWCILREPCSRNPL